MKTHQCATPAFLAFIAIAALAGPEPSLVKLRGVPFTDVQIDDDFWAPKQETNRTVSIPVNLENLVTSGNIRNLELAAKKSTSGFTGPVFMDSDVYKALEAASYSLATHPDPSLAKRIDEIIAIIAAAQQPDGYLNSYFTVKQPGKRWTNLRDWHELYCAGHMFEAAVAHYQATGKRNFLDIAIKFADHIDSIFGPGKRMGYPGHPEIELALIKLWKATGEQRYFNLSRFFIENRGKKYFAVEHGTPLESYDGTYWQDDVPIYEHTNIKGHAVRAAYLMSGATDVAAETGDAALLKMINRVWRNTTERNMYITGGIGPSAHNEGFTADYDLPNESAYQETCATIALAQWNQRLALLYGDARYADVVERALYNGMLAGVSQDGKCFFYVNPLESRGIHHRSGWFSCACCPPNVARTLASLGGYAYAASDKALWINLFIQGSVTALVAGEKLKMQVTGDYPWQGKITFRPLPAKPSSFELRLRLPGWCEGATVAVNGRNVEPLNIERGYIVLSRQWQEGDEVEMNLPIPVQRIGANPWVKANHGLVAIQRGPLVYCAEAADFGGSMPPIYLPETAELTPERNKTLLGGIVVIKGFAEAAEEQNWHHRLYQPIGRVKRVPFTAIPYYAWDNRTGGKMAVWLPSAPPPPRVGGPEMQAKVSVSFASGDSQPAGINDGIEPKSSGERPAVFCHWWPHKNTEEWAQYTWDKTVTVNGSEVYWFDDTGNGGCRLPSSWQIQYLDGDSWKPVKAKTSYPIAIDRWCEVTFEPVTTTALRLSVKLLDGWSAGVHEWRVVAVEEE